LANVDVYVANGQQSNSQKDEDMQRKDVKTCSIYYIYTAED